MNSLKILTEYLLDGLQVHGRQESNWTNIFLLGSSRYTVKWYLQSVSDTILSRFHWERCCYSYCLLFVCFLSSKEFSITEESFQICESCVWMTHLYDFLLFGLLEVKNPHSMEYICFLLWMAAIINTYLSSSLRRFLFGSKAKFSAFETRQDYSLLLFFPLSHFYCHLLLKIPHSVLP